jgi:hypothetical protein
MRTILASAPSLAQRCRTSLAALLVFASLSVFAVTFTSDTVIGIGNTTYDGTDIVVTNCTLTVDGPHGFNSVLVAAGGVLTHSFSPNGFISNLLSVANEYHYLSSTDPVTLLNSNVITASVVVYDYTGTKLYINNQDYLLTSPDGIVTQLQRTTNSTIPDGTAVLVSYTSLQGTAPTGLNISVTNNVEVAAGGSINATARGYGGGLGTGAGHSSAGSPQDGSGGGYGGNGGMSSSNAVGGATYGSFSRPVNLGSGGGSSYAGTGGTGGGSIQITAGGVVVVNGSIMARGANGTNSRSGGGSGGSVWITAQTFAGTGSIGANGGAAEPVHGGGGGGGRIALQYSTTTFSGTISAFGGAGAMTGGAGTVYTLLSGQNALLVVDNGGKIGTNTALTVSSITVDLLIRGNAVVVPATPATWSLGNLTIVSNCFLQSGPPSGQSPPSSPFTLNLAGNLTIQAGGGIVVDSAGYSPGSGTSPGRSYNDALYRPCGGGGYGGSGANGSPVGSNPGATGGASFGNQTGPNNYGSGGGTLLPYSIGGNGGGAINIICSKGGVVQLDGRLSANGGNGSGSGGGGGSGGSISLTGGTLIGSGSITANGGNGVDSVGGGGGGGRIYINATVNLFNGIISAYGGGGAGWGGAGTLFLQLAQPYGQNAQLILDNGGHAGTNSMVQSASADLVVQNGAIATATGSANFVNLFLNTSGQLAPTFLTQTPASPLYFSFSGNATVKSGAGIIADFAGYIAGQGPGAGHQGSSSNFSGAGHGGLGGSSAAAAGGFTYDVPTQPSQAGSGGGTSTYSFGGTGGGIIHLTVTGTLQLDGVISANAGNGQGAGGTGGGSGGSIYLVAGTLAGSGSITANGGNGFDSVGGGGGGGMIYVQSTVNNSFNGAMTAYGGTGANPGGPGTIVTKSDGQNSLLTLDNAGRIGPGTSITSLGTMDVLLRNGGVAVASGQGSLTLGNLQVGANSSLLVGPTIQALTLNLSSATIQQGGSIIAIGTNYQGTGIGHSYPNAPNYPCSGAGHGGFGGNSTQNLASGGIAYDSQSQPILPGSVGGGTQQPSIGGFGGGAVHLVVSGFLQIDGLLSANGQNGSGSGGGGGSGGSIWVSTGTLSGAGSITANGGNGVDSIGGGGAGGCIALYSTVSSFIGPVSAYGGSGANFGGAGSVVIQQSPAGTIGNVQYILDNGGFLGAPTPIQTVSASSSALIVRNGAVGYQQYPPQTFTSLLLSSNAWLNANPTSGNYLGTVNLTVTSNATVQAGCGIVTDSAGSGPGQGQGAGQLSTLSPNYPGGGAGYGGYGANPPAISEARGLAYGSTGSPTLNGSGGGGYPVYSIGGPGGGIIRLIVNGTLQNSGVISANGGNGSGLGGGGGSGGSVWLTIGNLTGFGTITANGGNGVDSIGGGGGGGRISIGYNTSFFTGNISAYGGSGVAYGGAGTVYLKANSQQYGQLTLDNGGHVGTNTVFDQNSVDLLIQGGAKGQWPSEASVRNLHIRSNSVLTTVFSTASQAMSFAGTATIDAGGAISCDGTGSGPASGPGAGTTIGSLKGGAGHGGYGGGYSPGNPGTVYGSIRNPITAGSGGANGSGTVAAPFGGAGGGALHLSVIGTLAVNGRVSSAGGNGSLNSGGGSGGSLWISAGTLVGSGLISANGGSGNGLGTGGGGGRIFLGYTANNFTGLVTAYGGGGAAVGGAGTIYTIANYQLVGPLLVDNGGASGANTPVSTALGTPAQPFNLTVQNGAVVSPQSSFPVLSNLTIGSGGTLAAAIGQPALLDLVVLKNLDIAPGGTLAVDGQGYQQGNGPGAGHSVNSVGSGAGYGRPGGASTTAAGGPSYGSAQQPLDFGSGGGLGYGAPVGGSAGGGAVRLNVGGILTVDGLLSAYGEQFVQANAGGGSGGSIWAIAGTLAGSGDIAADGGAGDFFGGGGGGAGGRIALYSRANIFFGQTTATGGDGEFPGSDGTIFISNSIAPLQITSQLPSGIVNSAVNSIDLFFNGAPNPNSVAASDFTLTTPNGPLLPGLLSFSEVSSAHYVLTLPLQTAVGNYSLVVTTNITDLFGQPMQPYTGAFTISLPVVQGRITDTHGQPVPGVLLQPDGGLSYTTTDTNGNYALGFIPGYSFTVIPSQGALVFVPSSISYTNLTASVANQNYMAVSTIAPALSTAASATNCALCWQSIPGVTYQVLCSTNLSDWTPYGSSFVGGQGPVSMSIPTGPDLKKFFRVQASN